VHDIVDLERLGVPGVCIATVEFESGAVAQARALGADPAIVYVPHPIQDRTDAEMTAIADAALAAILAQLIATSPHTDDAPADGGGAR
jgi:hypothetical protein